MRDAESVSRPKIDAPSLVAGFESYWRPAVFVWLIWALCTFIPVYLTRVYGPRLPYSDEWNLVPVITGHEPLSFGWLWAPHNEHRIVTAKLLSIILYRLTNADFRSVIFVNIILLSLLSAVTILTVRSIRGRTLYLDAFYPLFLLHLGQFAFFWGFGLPFTLVTTVVCLLSMIFLYFGFALSLSASVLAGSLLLLLPISGANGLLYVPGIAVWIFIRAAWRKRLGDPVMRSVRSTAASSPTRPTQVILLGSAAASIVISTAYFLGWHYRSSAWAASDIQQLMSAALRVLSAGFGQASEKFWPLSGIVSAIFVAASFVYAVLVGFDGQRSPAQRCRALDIAAFIVAFMPVALGVAHARGGRGSVSLSHYSTLALPILYWSFVSLSLGRSRLPAKFTQALLCAGMAILWIKYVGKAFNLERNHALRTIEIERELKNGAKSDIVAGRYMDQLFYVDLPETRKIVKDGIDGFRSAGFAEYGHSGNGH